MTLRAELIRLLREKPRTLEELVELTGHQPPTVKWHLIGIAEEKTVNGSTFYFLVDRVDSFQTHDVVVNRSAPASTRVDTSTWGELKACSTASKSKTKESNHIFSYSISKQNRVSANSSNDRENRGLHVVDNPDHGWLTKPLTLEDFVILDNLSPRQRQILKLLHVGKTQAQIARILKITRQAVYKHVKKFLRWDFIRKKRSLNGSKDIVYEVRRAVVSYLKLGDSRCKPRDMGGDSAPQRPLFSLHKLQLAYHIVNQSKPFTTLAPSFVKTYSPRGWTGYIYMIGNVRIRALPKKVIAELTEELKPMENETDEELMIRAIEHLKAAVERWLEEQAAYGVEIELSHPYVMNAPEFAFKSRLVKQYLAKLRQERKAAQLTQEGGIYKPVNEEVLSDVYLDDSPSETGEDYAHIETHDPDEADLVDKALRNALSFDNLIEEIRQVKALIESGIPVQQQMYQLMGIIGHLLKEISSLRQELALLKGERDKGVVF